MVERNVSLRLMLSRRPYLLPSRPKHLNSMLNWKKNETLVEIKIFHVIKALKNPPESSIFRLQTQTPSLRVLIPSISWRKSLLSSEPATGRKITLQPQPASAWLSSLSIGTWRRYSGKVTLTSDRSCTTYFNEIGYPFIVALTFRRNNTRSPKMDPLRN